MKRGRLCTARIVYCFRRRLEMLQAAANQRDMGAGFCEGASDAAGDTGATARDERYSVFQDSFFEN